MKLEQLAHGYADCREDEQGFTVFSRFTVPQQKILAEMPLFQPVSHHSAGIYLSFLTTGDEIRFQCKVPPRIKVIKALLAVARLTLARLRISRNGLVQKVGDARLTLRRYGQTLQIPMNLFELIVNGRSVAWTKARNGEIILKFSPSGPQPATVELYFPLLEGAAIKDFKVNGPVGATGQKPRRMLCLGDSITQGCLSAHPSKSYVNLLAWSLGAETINQGIAGFMHDAMSLEGIDQIPVPDLIIVALGTNDWNVLASADTIRQNVQVYYARLRQAFPTAPIYAITPIWRADMAEDRPCGSFKDITAIIAQVAAGYPGVTVIDGLAISPHNPSFYGDGYLHPNEDGFVYLADHLLPLLKA